jgi:hypothetical protein
MLYVSTRKVFEKREVFVFGMTSCIGEIRVVDKLPDKNRAEDLLKEVASWVEPVMKKQGWFVPLLSECNFGNPGILGMNHNGGQKIEIRLRRVGDFSSFFELESLMDTMLHELSHIVHHNHSAAFYELWEELRKELSANLSKVRGSGAGFDAKGFRVNPESRNPSSLLDARRKATKAAEKRLKTSQLFGSGPQKLGGSTALNGLGEAEAVRMATMKRCSEWCGNEEHSINQKLEDPKEGVEEPLMREDSAKETAKVAGERIPSQRKEVAASAPPAKIARLDTSWSCEKCTFSNEERDPICVMCTEGLKVSC